MNTKAIGLTAIAEWNSMVLKHLQLLFMEKQSIRHQEQKISYLENPF